MNTTPGCMDVDNYISRFPSATQEHLNAIRAIIRKNTKGAEEGISYGIPTFYLGGHYLIYFAGFKKHVSIYPVPRSVEPFRTILATYKGGKGTVQFPIGQPLPTALISRIVKFLVQAHAKRNLK